MNTFEEIGLVDVEPIKLVPTWRPIRIYNASVENKLDRFTVSSSIITYHDILRSCVDVGKESNNLTFILQIAKGGSKPPRPFKFNSSLLENEEFVQLVRLNGNSMIHQLVSSLLTTLRE